MSSLPIESRVEETSSVVRVASVPDVDARKIRCNHGSCNPAERGNRGRCYTDKYGACGLYPSNLKKTDA